MHWFSEIRFRLQAILNPTRMEQEMDEEMAFHLEMEVKKLVREGLSPQEARRRALRNFGDPMRQRERARRQWGIGWIQDLRSDAVLSVRSFGKAPVLTLVAVTTLALGIGASSAIFSVVNGVLLRPLPYPEADRLVALTHTMPGIGAESTPLSPALYRTFKEHSRALEAVGLWTRGNATVTGLGDPERVSTISVTAELFPLLGMEPALGRGFSQEDTGPGSASPVILSHGFWVSHFGANTDVLGRTLILGGRDRPIVGVAPAGARIQDSKADLYLPLRLDLTSSGVGNWSFLSIARLRPGTIPEQATRELSELTPLACELYPGIPLEELQRRKFGTVATPLKTALVGDIRRTLWLVFGGAGIVLLIACVNVANLFLVKAEGRARDVALRSALGASRERLVRQSLTDSLIIGGLGGGAGLLLAGLGVRLLLGLAPASLPRLAEVRLDPATLLFAGLVTLFTGLLFGLLPSFRPWSGSLSESLKEGDKGTSYGRGRVRARNAFAVIQVAMALVLLTASGLMVRTFKALQDVPPGYQRPEEVVTFRISVPSTEASSPEELLNTHREILRRISEIPGVTTQSAAASVAMEDWQAWEDVEMEDFPLGEGDPSPLRRLNWISPGHFDAMGNPLRAGRDLAWADVVEHRPVAIVSEAFAREFWATPDAALGKHFRTADHQPWQEIVGVAGDVRAQGVTEAAPAIIYFPFVMEGIWGEGVFTQRSLRYVIRTSRPNPLELLPDIRGAVRSVNPRLPLFSIQTLEGIFARSVARTSFVLAILGVAAMVAVILGMVGIYGVISYLVTQRTREMGIRLALGATKAQVRRMILREGMGLAGAGILTGTLAAIVLTRFMAALLFGVSPVDPLTFAAVSTLLATVVLLASYLPARRAAALDPTEALRRE